MKVGLVGHFPPATGGVSTYCIRRYQELSRSSNIDRVDKISLGYLSLLSLVYRRYDAYEINSLHPFVLATMYCFRVLSRSTLIDHNASRHYEGLLKRLILFFVGRVKKVQIVNPSLAKFYPDYIDVHLFSPFIPPSLSDRCVILKKYERSVIEFMSSDFIINPVGKYVKLRDGDLYGVRESLLLLENIPTLRMIITFGKEEIHSIPHSLSKSMESFEKNGRLKVVFSEHEVWPLIEKSKLCLRLTATDGDSVTVREALWLGVTTLASNVTIRPQNCLIYEHKCYADLKNKVESLYRS